MALLKVRPSVPPPTLTRAYDALARPPLDTRDAWAAGPAHVCKQEDGQTLNMSHWDHHGSHSSSHSQAASASGRHAQSRRMHEAGTVGSRLKSQQRTC